MLEDQIVEYFKTQNMIKFVEDIECPIKCGNCCYECMNLSITGCVLERDQRPQACLMYLCGDATEKLYEGCH